MNHRWLHALLPLFLSFALLLTAIPVSAGGAPAEAAGWRFTAAPEKEAYAAGEEITIKAVLENASLQDLRHCSVLMTYSKTDTYLAAGKVEQTLMQIEPNEKRALRFSLYEDDAVKTAGENMGRVLRLLSGLLKKLVHGISQLSPLFAYLSARSALATENFPGNLPQLCRLRRVAVLGKCAAVYDGQTVTCTFYMVYDRQATVALPDAVPAGTLAADETAAGNLTVSDGIELLTFGADAPQDRGVLFFDGSSRRIGLARLADGGFRSEAFRLADIDVGETYPFRLERADGILRFTLYTNPLDDDPYPTFELPDAFSGGALAASGGIRDLTVTKTQRKAQTGRTYTNPVCDNAPDPYILFDDGIYYLYATNNPDGYDVYTSTDLVNWSYACRAAYGADLLGERNYWAPEVYKYNGKYYLLYTSEVHLGVAVADSPTGPFVKNSDRYLFEDDTLDGNFFFDDDGKVYLYFSRSDRGQTLWVCEMNETLTAVVPGTERLISSPEGWEIRINEGPCMLKHNGVYYLTYSGDGYDSINYGVGYMTSTSPYGPFTKCPQNPVLKYNAYLYGPGHHCFAASPDGSELFICYHCHYSTTQVHERRLCIDRVKFVPTESGVDALCVYGPTVTPQPYPAG